jgi:predicted DNA-binding transcriptional regulator AlpA
MKQLSEMPRDGYGRTGEVLEFVPFSRATMLSRSWRERNSFPEPTKISEAITGWSWSEIRKWLESRPRGVGRRVPKKDGEAVAA